MEVFVLVLSLLIWVRSATAGPTQPVSYLQQLAALGPGTVLYVEDMTDPAYYWLVWDNNRMAMPCQPFLCVPKGFGAQTVQPCSVSCTAPPPGPATTPAPPPPLPPASQSSCNFEVNMCGWTVEGTGYRWVREQGPGNFMRTYGTGPQVDHTSGSPSGWHLFAEGDDGLGGASTRFVSGLMNGIEPYQLSLFYHLTGAHTNSISVIVRTTDGKNYQLWKKTGVTDPWTGYDWKEAKIALPGGIPSGYQIVIEANGPITGSEGDLAIDDITIKPNVPSLDDCASLQSKGYTLDGLYFLALPNGVTAKIYCDVDVGMTVISRRVDGSLNFTRNWQEYKNGFYSATETWLGLELLSRLTLNANYQLHIELQDYYNKMYYATYSKITVNGEVDNYRLNLGPYVSAVSTAGDALNGVIDASTTYTIMKIHGMPFSTYDRDNDMATSVSCANQYGGGWWYNNCEAANINAPYTTASYCLDKCIHWFSLGLISFKSAVMKIEKI